jgi:hypothetical protein
MNELYRPETVAEAARYLDETVPGWAPLIDKRILDMGSTQTCILGQLYYASPRFDAARVDDDGCCPYCDAREVLGVTDSNSVFSAYRDEWVAEIGKRLAP